MPGGTPRLPGGAASRGPCVQGPQPGWLPSGPQWPQAPSGQVWWALPSAVGAGWAWHGPWSWLRFVLADPCLQDTGPCEPQVQCPAGSDSHASDLGQSPLGGTRASDKGLFMTSAQRVPRSTWAEGPRRNPRGGAGGQAEGSAGSKCVLAGLPLTDSGGLRAPAQPQPLKGGPERQGPFLGHLLSPGPGGSLWKPSPLCHRRGDICPNFRKKRPNVSSAAQSEGAEAGAREQVVLAGHTRNHRL